MQKNWYAVITADVLYDKQLTSRQKLLIAVISNLANEKGYCFASNKYFSEILDCSIPSIQRDLSVLEGKYLGRVIKLNDKRQVEYRALTPISPVIPPHITSDTTPHITSDMYNNIYSNNIYNNIPPSEGVENLDSTNPKKEKPSVGEEKEKSSAKKEKETVIDFSALITIFNKHTGKKSRIVTDKAKTNLKKALEKGYTKEDIRNTIIRASKDEFHIENNMKWVTLEYISRLETLDKYSTMLEKKEEKVKLNMNT